MPREPSRVDKYPANRNCASGLTSVSSLMLVWELGHAVGGPIQGLAL